MFVFHDSDITGMSSIPSRERTGRQREWRSLPFPTLNPAGEHLGYPLVGSVNVTVTERSPGTQ